LLAPRRAGLEDLFDLGRDAAEFFNELDGALSAEAATKLPALEREQEERGELRREGLVETTPISGPAWCRWCRALRATTASTTLQMATVFEPSGTISRWVASVSAVSPDWVMSRPRALRSRMGLR